MRRWRESLSQQARTGPMVRHARWMAQNVACTSKARLAATNKPDVVRAIVRSLSCSFRDTHVADPAVCERQASMGSCANVLALGFGAAMMFLMLLLSRSSSGLRPATSCSWRSWRRSRGAPSCCHTYAPVQTRARQRARETAAALAARSPRCRRRTASSSTRSSSCSAPSRRCPAIG